MNAFQKVQRFIVRYERHLSVLSMVGGFILDNLALERADLPFETYLLYSYLALSGVFILAIHLAEEGVWKGKLASYSRPWLPLALQFISGSMFSAFLVFYSRSASLLSSWPFLAVLFAVFAGTEIFKRYQDRLAFQSAILFFGIFSFAIYSVPLWMGRIGSDVFLLSGAAALAVFSIFFALLFATGPRRLKAATKKILASVLGVLAVVNIFYFTHLLPPLPLALRDIGVYHSVTRIGGGYAVQGEEESWLSAFLGESDVRIRPGEPVYVFSSVFTPVAVKTNIVHRWERFDTIQNRWVLNSIIAFPASGGRDGGYRGYSEVGSIPPGQWRVSVETPDGRLIGRVAFTVSYVSAEPALTESVL